MNQDDVFLTAEGLERLRADLRHLQEVRRPEVAAMIRDAKEAGDISENAAYDEAKEQQAMVEARIRHLEEVLSRAQEIEVSPNSNFVSLGHSVTVVEEGEAPETFQIVGSAEADPGGGSISNESPLGRALLGKRVGDSATFVAPSGQTMTFKVLSIA
jgi:transcription elongation factor GreA